MPRSSVVIPVFNQASLTAQCLQAIVDRDDCEVVVVDDASTDATPALLSRFGDSIRVVTHETNAGFASSCNDGAEAASGQYLIFLNNDTIPQRGWLDALIEHAERHPTAGVVGSKLLYHNNTVQHAGVVICQDRYPRHIYKGLPAHHPAVNKSRRFQIVTAACMLVRRSAFEQAGGFDMAFRNGLEDVDLCLRLGERLFEIHYCADSVVYHLESVSPGRFKNDGANVALYRQRWIDHVQPDDLRYYAEDGLLSLAYEDGYPLTLEVSPELAAVHDATGGSDTEKLLHERTQRVAELLRENTRLTMALGEMAPDSQQLRYAHSRKQVCEFVQQVVPVGSTVLVISKGDSSFLDFAGRKGWHFPQTARGNYAGHHPADSADAITLLEESRAKGADYLAIPATSFWWLEHYQQFFEHLKAHYGPPRESPESVVFCLTCRQIACESHPRLSTAARTGGSA